MQIDKNRNSVLRQLAALQKMSLSELQNKWRDLYGAEAPQFKKAFLEKRLAYRIQELFYGGLPETAERHLAELAENDPLARMCRKEQSSRRYLSKGKLLPGTRLIREWNGNRYEVTAKEKGFVYDGRDFRSLSAIATAITGTKWNGKAFFGLRDNI